MGSGLIILQKAVGVGMLEPCPGDRESQLEDLSTTR